MNILILGASGFIGTNLTIQLAQNKQNKITLIDRNEDYFSNIKKFNFKNVHIKISNLDLNTDWNEIVSGQDVVYHLISTVMPTNSNKNISKDIESNVLLSSHLFDACVLKRIKKVIFISSGGTVYGREFDCPLSEETPTNPITSYGIQKITIEKLLYLYNYLYGLDYKIIRLANPYGPYQRPNGMLGAITTFTYKALRGENIEVYGNGSVIRDFIYIDDAVKAILKIANSKTEYNIFNLGSGYGTSIKEVLNVIHKVLGTDLKITYKEKRAVDVPINFLDISRYEKCFGKLDVINLEDGIRKTVEFMKNNLQNNIKI